MAIWGKKKTEETKEDVKVDNTKEKQTANKKVKIEYKKEGSFKDGKLSFDKMGEYSVKSADAKYLTTTYPSWFSEV